MCVWITEIPKKSKTEGIKKTQNLMMFLKPTEEKEYYRFRLLGFMSAKSDRDSPFIPRFIHQVWVDGEDGKRHTEKIVCPVTEFVRDKWNGNPMDDCPLCRFSNANYGAWRNSNWKDKEASKKYKEYGRKYEAIVPVYVVNDPVYPQNNGHFRAFAFYDKKEFEAFKDLGNKYIRGFKDSNGIYHDPKQIFNGKQAIDFYIRYEIKEEVKNPGQPNEYHWKHPVLARMGFADKKVYDIPAITKEAIDKFPFDDTFYVASTMSELQDFYNRHVKVSNDDIPDEDEEIDLVPKKQEEPKVQKTNSIEKSEVKVDSDPVSDLPFDDGSDIDDVPAPKSDKEVEEDINDLLDEEEEPKAEVATPAKKEAEPAGEILESPKDPMKTETSDEDLDKLLDDIL